MEFLYIMAWFSLTLLTISLMSIMIEIGNFIAYGATKLFYMMQEQPQQPQFYGLKNIQSNYEINIHDKSNVAA